MRWLLLFVLGGCDYILNIEEHAGPNPYESTTHDEDGDGTADAVDLCPHVREHSELDTDRDGIGDDCDPRPDGKDDRHFFAFENGSLVRLVADGDVAIEADAVVLGQVDENHAALVFATLAADTTYVEASVEYLRSGFEEKVSGVGYSELNIHSVHRNFTTDNTQRGDSCFAGIDANAPNNTVTNFLEIKQDDVDLGGREDFAPPLAGLTAIYVQERSPTQLSCAIIREGAGRVATAESFSTPRTTTGSVAIDAVNTSVRVHYLWIVTPRL